MSKKTRPAVNKKTRPAIADLEQRQEEELTPEQAEQVTGGSNGNFPPGQFPSSGGSTSYGPNSL